MKGLFIAYLTSKIDTLRQKFFLDPPKKPTVCRGDRGLPEAGSSPLLSVVILGHWVIVSSCAFVVDRRPLVEHSSSKYTQAWEAVHLKRFWASRTFLL